MTPAIWAAIGTSAAALISALAAYIRQRAHTNDPNAHTGSRFQ